MKYMNLSDIESAVRRHQSHPVLSKATKFLLDFSEEVNMHSDGWGPHRDLRRLQEEIKEADIRRDERAKISRENRWKR